MNVLVVSDTHGNLLWLTELLNRVKPIDLLVHAGDLGCTKKRLEELAGCRVYAVRGNCDYEYDLKPEEHFMLGTHKVLLVHGHHYSVDYGTEMLCDRAKQQGAELVIFGHTHRQHLSDQDGITFLNPGSISRPRDEGGKHGFAWVELDASGNLHYTLNQLEPQEG